MTINFADPEREPTDEELAGLSHEAFAGVAAANERALAALRQRIQRGRERLVADLAETTRGAPR